MGRWGCTLALLAAAMLEPAAADDDCSAGHVVAQATNIVLHPIGGQTGVTPIEQAGFNPSNNLDDFLDRYVTVTQGDQTWPTSTYLIANDMKLERVNGADIAYYHLKYSIYPADYAASATKLSIGADINGDNVPTETVNLTAYAWGCAPSQPPSPSSPPSPLPTPPPPPDPPPPPFPPHSPPAPPPHDGYWEVWMAPVILGIGGPLLVLGCLMCAINTCGLFTFKYRETERDAIEARHAAEHNGERLTEMPPAAYSRRLRKAYEEEARRKLLQDQLNSVVGLGGGPASSPSPP